MRRRRSSERLQAEPRRHQGPARAQRRRHARRAQRARRGRGRHRRRVQGAARGGHRQGGEARRPRDDRGQDRRVHPSGRPEGRPGRGPLQHRLRRQQRDDRPCSSRTCCCRSCRPTTPAGSRSTTSRTRPATPSSRSSASRRRRRARPARSSTRSPRAGCASGTRRSCLLEQPYFRDEKLTVEEVRAGPGPRDRREHRSRALRLLHRRRQLTPDRRTSPVRPLDSPVVSSTAPPASASSLAAFDRVDAEALGRGADGRSGLRPGSAPHRRDRARHPRRPRPRRRGRDRRRRRQHLPRHGRGRAARHGPRVGRLRGHARDGAERPLRAGRARAPRRLHARAVARSRSRRWRSRTSGAAPSATSRRSAS